jgi:hypothetical protein
MARNGCVCSAGSYEAFHQVLQQQRLGNESMRNFDACSLCLQRAREPIACDQGHLFCKECAYTDLCKFIMTWPVSYKLSVQWHRKRISSGRRNALSS